MTRSSQDLALILCFIGQVKAKKSDCFQRRPQGVILPKCVSDSKRTKALGQLLQASAHPRALGLIGSFTYIDLTDTTSTYRYFFRAALTASNSACNLLSVSAS